MLQPAGGAGDKVFPPTYLDAKYADEQRVIPGGDGSTESEPTRDPGKRIKWVNCRPKLTRRVTGSDWNAFSDQPIDGELQKHTARDNRAMNDYSNFFQSLLPAGRGWPLQPHPWQLALGRTADCGSRLIRIPTGLGKTEGVLGAWLYHAVYGRRADWPRRLLWCLPMRVLVEQTAERAASLIDRWAATSDLQSEERPQVHVLMGGETPDRWWLYPERPAVLIGTQDMLLSRALNRGYASPRARWPMEYALIHQDCLWVMDEVQLMDVGLATSAQLQAFRDQNSGQRLRPCFTWWMSATLQPDWLHSVDTEWRMNEWTSDPCVVSAEQRTGALWEGSKSLQLDAIAANNRRDFAQRILREHENIADGDFGKITLVVCNTVKRATETFAALQLADCSAELELVHSRFRPYERADWRTRFLCRDACQRGADRIIVATQVVEAGVDISAGCLLTELAPWPNLVQRFGRCARYGGSGNVVVIDRGQDPKTAVPYDAAELEAAWQALGSLDDVALGALERCEDQLDDDTRARLYSYAPPHLLMRDEFDELFDTTPDLTGADLDISRFIRSGDERDLQVFWDDVPGDQSPPDARQPRREELCTVPFLAARDWLCEKNQSKLRKSKRAWLWDWIDGCWVAAQREQLLPGRIVCVDADCGGYSQDQGFTPDSNAPVPVVPLPASDPFVTIVGQSDHRQDGEPLSASGWKTIATHASEVAELVADIAARLALPAAETKVLKLAARWHDLGKSHPAFQGKIGDAADQPRPDRNDLAKGPDSAWLKPPGLYVFRDNPSEKRPGFRHELASALALFSVLKLYSPRHPALLGPWGELIQQLGQTMPAAELCRRHAPRGDPGPHQAGQPNPETSQTETIPVEVAAVLDCDATQFNLLAYLVAAHHGQLRVALHSAPADQEYPFQPEDDDTLPIRGVRGGDVLPSISLTPESAPLPELPLTLSPAEMGLSFETGASWRERTQSLLDAFGPTRLALLETLLRAADIRASRLPTADPTLSLEVVR